MYKFFLVFLMSFLSAQQKCNLSFFNNPYLHDGKITFRIQNSSNGRAKVPILFNAEFARPTDIQIYSSESKKYIASKYSFDGTLCGDPKQCFGKMVRLKKGEKREYEVKIIPGRISGAFKEKKKYRFKLSFDTYFFSGCNDYITDWLYYDNTN